MEYKPLPNLSVPCSCVNRRHHAKPCTVFNMSGAITRVHMKIPLKMLLLLLLHCTSAAVLETAHFN